MNEEDLRLFDTFKPLKANIPTFDMETSSDLDLITVKTVQQKDDGSSSTSILIPEPIPFDKAATRRLLLKLDLHLIPFPGLLYLLCFLDRTNVGNARLAGLEHGLKMTDWQFNISLAILPIFFIIADIPGNIAMKLMRPSIWLTIVMVSVGLVTICHGLVHNYTGFLICRAFLGLAEGGLFPGAIYFITMWYQRHEVGFRIAMLASFATLAGMFGGLFSRAISNLNGLGGKGGWAWIFIIEGLITLCFGSISYWAISDFPSTARFLTPAERVEVKRRMAADSNELPENFEKKYVFQALTDWKIWVNMLITFGIFTALFSTSQFLPTIINDMGYSKDAAMLMSAPPFAVACVLTLCVNFVADKTKQRGFFLLGFEVITIVGFVMLVSSKNTHVQYAGSFLAIGANFPLLPLTGAWNSNNIGGTIKRGVGIAMQIGFANLGGTVAAFIYLPSAAPRYIQGHCILIGIISLSMILTGFMTFWLRRENARRDAIMRARNVLIRDYSPEMRREEREKGDKAIFFRYTV